MPELEPLSINRMPSVKSGDLRNSLPASRSWLLIPFCTLLVVFSTSGASDPNFDKWFYNYVNKIGPASLGIYVVDASNGQKLFGYNEGKLLKPASTAKIVTGALFLDKFGSNHYIKTPIYLFNQSENNKIAGGLAILGKGDISLGARFYRWDYTKSISRLVNAIAETGVRQINGPVILDDNFFKNSKYGTGWTWEDLKHYYGAPVSSLPNDDNVIDIFIRPGRKIGDPCRIECKPKPLGIIFSNETITVAQNQEEKINIHRGLDSTLVTISGQLSINSKTKAEAVSVAYPAKWLGLRLKDALKKKGIVITGDVEVFDNPDRPFIPKGRWENVNSFTSHSSRSMLNKMMKRSQNLYAQSFLLQVGKLRKDYHNFYSTEEAGIKSLNDWCYSIGIPKKEVGLDEGSGLSRSSLISARAMTKVLFHMISHPERKTFMESLPIAGIDGALRYRLRHESTKGLIKAKSGSIKHVRSLAGYIDRKDKRRIAFCILLNGFNESSHPYSGKRIVDEITLNIATRRF